MINKILKKTTFTQSDLVTLLKTTGEERHELFRYAAEIKEKYVQNKVYLRGLIEFSNICGKDCYYCGIRRSNTKVKRYNLTDEDILNAAYYAYKQNYGSIVMQSGELDNKKFTGRITGLLKRIKEFSDGNLRVTLSCGEQDLDTYQEWFNAGASRYLIRIEASNKDLYMKLHPNDELHAYERRLQALKDLRTAGFQTGTGVMIGVPFQTLEDLADDLLFFPHRRINPQSRSMSL